MSGCMAAWMPGCLLPSSLAQSNSKSNLTVTSNKEVLGFWLASDLVARLSACPLASYEGE